MLSSLALFGISMLVGAVVLTVKSTWRLRAYRQSLAWPKVHATVTQSSTRAESDGDGISHLPEFSFRYTVAGVNYISSRHTEGTPFPGTEDDVHQMLERFPVGSTVQVSVKPGDPSCAILDTGFPKAWNVLRYVSLLALAVGIGITFFEGVLAK